MMWPLIHYQLTFLSILQQPFYSSTAGGTWPKVFVLCSMQLVYKTVCTVLPYTHFSTKIKSLDKILSYFLTEVFRGVPPFRTWVGTPMLASQQQICRYKYCGIRQTNTTFKPTNN